MGFWFIFFWLSFCSSFLFFLILLLIDRYVLFSSVLRLLVTRYFYLLFFLLSSGCHFILLCLLIIDVTIVCLFAIWFNKVNTSNIDDDVEPVAFAFFWEETEFLFVNKKMLGGKKLYDDFGMIFHVMFSL